MAVAAPSSGTITAYKAHYKRTLIGLLISSQLIVSIGAGLVMLATKLFIWQDEEDYIDENEKCRLEVTQVSSNSINLTTKESNCNYYCGARAFIEDGIFRK